MFTSRLLCVIGHWIHINLRKKNHLSFSTSFIIAWKCLGICGVQPRIYIAIRLDALLLRSLVVRIIASFGTRNILPWRAEHLNRRYLKDCGICLPQRRGEFAYWFFALRPCSSNPCPKKLVAQNRSCLPPHLSSLTLAGLHSSPQSWLISLCYCNLRNLCSINLSSNFIGI